MLYFVLYVFVLHLKGARGFEVLVLWLADEMQCALNIRALLALLPGRC